MKLPDLLKKHRNKEIVDRLVELYPDMKRSAPGYRKVIKNLRTMEPKARDDGMRISVYHVVDDLIPEDVSEYESVSGVIEGDSSSYAIEYTPWNEWLGMEITPETIENYTEVDIIAHCLWEMTFSGFEEEEIQGTISSLYETVAKIKREQDNDEQA